MMIITEQVTGISYCPRKGCDGTGKGKEIIIFAPLGFEPGELEVMYGFAQFMTDNLHDLIVYLADLWEREEEFQAEKDPHNCDSLKCR